MDCGLFAGLVLNNERPKAAFLFNDVLQQTDAQTDPSSYRPYIIRHLLAYVHTVPDDVMAGALDESSLLRSLCAQIPNAPDRKLDMRSQRRALKINTHKIIHIVLEAVCKNLLQALAVKARDRRGIYYIKQRPLARRKKGLDFPLGRGRYGKLRQKR